MSGPLPAAWGNLSNLEHLYLENNDLTGPLPATWSGLEKLWQLKLSKNRLAGPLPLSLIKLTALGVFYFDDTELCIPDNPAFDTWLRKVGNVQGYYC